MRQGITISDDVSIQVQENKATNDDRLTDVLLVPAEALLQTTKHFYPIWLHLPSSKKPLPLALPLALALPLPDTPPPISTAEQVGGGRKKTRGKTNQ